MRRHAWTVAFAIAVALVYAAVAGQMAGARYQLVNDFRPFAMAKVVSWPSAALTTLFDVTAADAWLYRPFPDVMESVLSRVFGTHSGAWHLLMLGVRLMTIVLAVLIARATNPSPASIAAAAYLAFFPAIPELQLIRAESWVMPVLALAFLGWLQSAKHPKTTAIAFLLATMAKEVLAPLLIVLFVLLAPFYWKRHRWLLGVMTLALLNQLVRFLLVFADPYAKSAGLIATVRHNVVWVAKTLLLFTTTFPLFSLFLAIWFVLGAIALLRLPRMRAAGIAILFLGAIGMALIAPYQAIRYVYPAALFAIPILALGVERMPSAVAVIALAVLAIFGGATLWAQAVSANASSRADWALLETLDTAFAKGGTVVIVDDEDFERAFWMRAELVGVDPRWPFLSYVARQYAAGKPVQWPAPPPPVNLTGKGAPNGKLLLVPKTFDVATLPPNAIVVNANPAGPAPLASRSARFLERVRLAMLHVHRRFRYEYDLGETVFPGHAWKVWTAATPVAALTDALEPERQLALPQSRLRRSQLANLLRGIATDERVRRHVLRDH